MQKWRSSVKTAKHQIYISRTRNPFLNLSIEHFLLEKSPRDSTILFLYVNQNCAVIGRNQNPWLEVNLRYLQRHGADLVRRRSGGGAVFHDEGNINYSVICPPQGFFRDKHAQMVTKAIRATNDRARVNERHDIVLDRGPRLSEWPHSFDMHLSKYSAGDLQPLKVSGSAYKIIRHRCLHHGTCLLNSQNLPAIPKYLSSPARGFLKAKGVSSVRSPVGNILKGAWDQTSEMTTAPMDKLREDIVAAFTDMYGLDTQSIARKLSSKDSPTPSIWSEKDLAVGFIGDETQEIQEIANGVAELKSPSWIYGQTPEFTLSNDAYNKNDFRGLAAELPQSAQIFLEARRGVIEKARLSLSSSGVSSPEQILFHLALAGKHIHEVENFTNIPIYSTDQVGQNVSSALAWLDEMFSKPGRFSQKRLDLS